MRAAFVNAPDPANPMAALVIGDRPEPPVRDGWTRLTVRAASLNHHDIFTLRGVGVTSESFPMILGCDAAGIDESGRPVVVHAVIGDPSWSGDPTLDPALSVLSEREQGTFAEVVAVPTANLIPLPEGLSFEAASCLPTAWVTAYHMLFCQAQVRAGDTVLVQGATGGLAAATVAIAASAGIRVWLTSRQPDTAGDHLLALGADRVVSHGSRLPSRVDAVLDGVGARTWEHSLKSLRPGGTLVAVGGVAGFEATTDLGRVIRNRLRVVGSLMGCQDDLVAVAQLCADGRATPVIDQVIGFDGLSAGLERLLGGGVAGKVVLVP